MTSRDRKATEKGCEYQLELKCKAVGEAWKSLKSVSEDLRSFMAEKRSVKEAKVLYAQWMELSSSRKSSARLAAEARRMEELKKMEMFLEEKQELERKAKLMEIKLQQEKERSRIREEIARSQSRSQMILEMEHEDADSQDLGEDVVYNGMLDKQGRDSEDEGLHDIDGESLGGKRSTLRSLDKVLLELQKPQLEAKKFDGDCLSYTKFMRQFKSRIENICTNDEKMAYLEQYTTGEAHRVVAGYSFLPSDVGFKAAIKELSRRYGDAEVMANSYVQQALQWPMIRADDPKSLDAFSMFLNKCEAATRCIGTMNILEHTENLRQMLKKLPVYMHDRWRTVVQKLNENGKMAKFSNLVEFVESEAKKLNDPVWGRNALSCSQRREQKKPKVMTAATNASEGLKCWDCDESHRIRECPKLKESNLTERRSLLRTKKLCFNCLGKGHLSTGCPSNAEERSKKQDENPADPGQSGVSNAVASGRCAMSIIPVKVLAGSKMVICNAFLDPGCNVSFITESLAEKLKVAGKKTTISLKTMGNTVNQQTTMIHGLQISAPEGEEVLVDLPTVFTKPNLPVEAWKIPTNKDLAAWSHLKTISLPDTRINASIDVLIGNNVPAALAPTDVVTGPVGSPFATKTVLGWVVWGVSKKQKMPTISNYVCADVSLKKLYRASLDFDFPERAADDKREWSWEDKRFMKVMDESCVLVDGHYRVDLPIRDPELKLPCNLRMAENRLESLKKKMSKNDQFRHDYKAFLQDMVDKGKFPVAFSSDVECMFYQVKVPGRQGDFLRFLWWPDGDVLQKPKAYRMTVHLFGAASSPSCANYGLKKTGFDNRSEASLETVRTLNEDFYMGDCLKSVQMVDEAITMVKDLKCLCKEGGFNLTKWCSNRREVLAEIPPEDLSKGLRSLDLDSSQLPPEKTLGILWNPEDDQFQFQCNFKNILQDMCKQNAGGDDQPDENVMMKWDKWLKCIEDIKEIKINRCYVPRDFGEVTHRELHVFSDASELGNGITIYVRSSESEWRNDATDLKMDFDDPEVKSSCAVLGIEEQTLANTLATQISNWVKIKRVMAWILLAVRKFMNLIRRKPRSEVGESWHLTVELLEKSEISILRLVQLEAFPKEMDALEKGNMISRRSLLFKYASLLTKNGMIRIAGRIGKADVSYEARHPVVLPKSSRIVQLIVRDAHKRVGHLGKNAIVAKTREGYWIYGVNQLAKKVARECSTCRKYQARPLLKEQSSVLDDETLATVLCEADNILNNRPLTATSTDPNDMLPLTPNMLINPRGRPLDAPGQFEKSDLYAKRRWRRVQYLVHVFWT
eukprot:gene13144-14495_t